MTSPPNKLSYCDPRMLIKLNSNICELDIIIRMYPDTDYMLIPGNKGAKEVVRKLQERDSKAGKPKPNCNRCTHTGKIVVL